MMLELMKQILKARNKIRKCFHYLVRKFPRLYETKMKEEVFDGPQIRTVLVSTMTELEKDA